MLKSLISKGLTVPHKCENRIGNSPTAKIIEILRGHFLIIVEFFDSETESLLILS